MLLKEYRDNWPPTVTIGDADFTDKVTVPPKANLGDIVLKVQNRAPGELELRLRHTKQAEYSVLLQVPSSVQKKILSNIVQKKNMTLREVGELRIA